MPLAYDISVDHEVYKKIFNAKQTGEESDNDALRLLLGMGRGASDFRPITASSGANGALPALPSQGEPLSSIPKGSWVRQGVVLPPGTELRMERGGRPHLGEIKDKRWVFYEQPFKSPSAAALYIARDICGEDAVAFNGWLFFDVRLPHEKNWQPLHSLREQTRRRRRRGQTEGARS